MAAVQRAAGKHPHAAAAVGFWWHRDSAGYDFEEHLKEDAGKNRMMPCIVARGGEDERYRLEGTSNRVFEDLASADCTPEDALKFTNKWGFLCRHHLGNKEMILDELSGFYDQVHYFQNMLNFARLKNYKDLIQSIRHADTSAGKISGTGHFTLDVVMRPGVELPHVFIRPDSLLSFATIELMQTIAGAAEIRTCLHCRKFFTLSSEANRRSTRQYCSDRCRVAMSRARKESENEASLPVPAPAAPSPPPEPLPRPALPPRRRRKPER